MQELFKKYNVPVPRYTSYPTVPDWKVDDFNQKDWSRLVENAYQIIDQDEGISLYIHLPYCESLCTYCGCNTRITVNHDVEKPYIEALLKEFKMYLEVFNEQPLIKEIHLGGGTPTFFTPENLKLLIDSILSQSSIHKEAVFSFEAHPLNTSYEHLSVLSELGFTRLSLGIQDFDSTVQIAINRKQSFDQVKKVVDWARELGYDSINFDVIFGLPFQKICSVNDTIEKVLQLKPERIAYYSYAHVPWKHPGQRAYDEGDLPDSFVKRSLYEFGKSKLLSSGYFEIGMDHFGLDTDELYVAQENGNLHRNFMGYVTKPSPLLIGLGVSSISDLSIAYAQNVKTVEGYLMKINGDSWALAKGHSMSESDQLIKKAIHQILCNQEIKIGQVNQLPIEIRKRFFKQTEEFISEGLLTQKFNKLCVTDAGKVFIRNIASLLDQYQSPLIKSKYFSKSV